MPETPTSHSSESCSLRINSNEFILLLAYKYLSLLTDLHGLDSLLIGKFGVFSIGPIGSSESCLFDS